MAAHHQHYQDTLQALRRLSSSSLREHEHAAVAEDLSEVDAMLEKLEHGVVEIAAFGEINSGKSSLLNALLGRKVFDVSAEGGKTRARAKHEWAPTAKEFPGFAGSKLIVVDTPGINEVAGAERAEISKRTVRYCDIVLFVSFGDLNDIEFNALKALHELNKPIILVLNKIDLFKRRELEETVRSVRDKVKGLIGEADIVFAAGDPGPAWRVVPLPYGGEREEEITRAPIIEDLQARIIEILRREGKAVVAFNANLFASEVSERIAAIKAETRHEEAQTLIRRFMWIKALAVALNPIPIADIAGGAVSDVVMVQRLGAVYGQAFSTANARNLIREILGAWGVAVTVEWVTHLVSGALKGAAPVVGHAVVAIPQALAASWTSYVVGQAANRYFRDGGWGEKGAKAIVREILSGADRDSVLQPLKEKLLLRLESKVV